MKNDTPSEHWDYYSRLRKHRYHLDLLLRYVGGKFSASERHKLTAYRDSLTVLLNKLDKTLSIQVVHLPLYDESYRDGNGY